MSLSLVRKILWGKRTDVFQAVENETLDENVCFSMQTSDYTIDFECDTRYEQTFACKYIHIYIHVRVNIYLYTSIDCKETLLLGASA